MTHETFERGCEEVFRVTTVREDGGVCEVVGCRKIRFADEATAGRCDEIVEGTVVDDAIGVLITGRMPRNWLPLLLLLSELLLLHSFISSSTCSSTPLRLTELIVERNSECIPVAWVSLPILESAWPGAWVE